MDRWAGRVALVTGASVGIGVATAERLVRAGMTVVGCARNVHQIEEISKKLEGEKGKLHPIQCDLSKEEEILSMFESIRRDHGRLDVCINNAGLSHKASILGGDTEHWRNMMDVNVIALCICSREAYKLMKESGIDDGHIILINSMSGHRVVPSMTSHFYCATKHAVKAICESLRQELREFKSKIRVSEISPGVVETEFVYRMQGEAAAKKLYSSLKALEAEDIAATVEFLLAAPPHVQVHDVLMRPTEQKS